MSKRPRFRGHLDRIGEGYIFGWLLDSKSPRHSVVFELFIRGRYRGQWHCSYLRSDLAQAGLGTGVHGFKIPLIPSDELALGYEEIEFFIPQARMFMTVGVDGQLLPKLPKRFGDNADLLEFRRRLEKDAAHADEPAAIEQFSRLAADRLSTLVTYKDIRLGEIGTCDFTEFLRRLRGPKWSDVAFYTWYVNDYIFKIDRKYIPLSKDEIDFLRNSMERDRDEIITPDLGTPFKALFPGKYRSIIDLYPSYWWLVEGGQQLGLDYACAPGDAVARLTQTSQYGFGRSFPLSYFMLIFALRNRLVSPVAMLFPKGRRRVYEWCRAYALQNNHLQELSRKSAALLDGDNQQIQSPKQITHVGTTPGGVGAPSFEQHRSPDLPVKVQLIGPFDKILGLGESARRLASALGRVGVEYKLSCYNDGIQSFSTDEKFDFEIKKAEINIIHINLEQIPEFFLKYGDELSGSYNIVFPYWELNNLSSLHLIGLDFIDEVWSASAFIEDLFRQREVRVSKIGLPAKRFERSNNTTLRKDDDFTFLTAFDAHSWPQRKNPAGVVAAFREAFGDRDDVRLIIKTQNADAVHTKTQRQAWETLQQNCVGDGRIQIINETFTPEDQRKLLASADCLVSLHRSEGLGIDILDAIASGLPVVATAYSGNLDICTAENSWPVDYDLIPVSPEDYVFVENGHLWAEPSHDSAVKALMGVYSDHQARRDKILQGLADAERRNSELEISKRIAARLAVIFPSIEDRTTGWQGI